MPRSKNPRDADDERPVIPTKPEAGVIATRPATAPVAMPSTAAYLWRSTPRHPGSAATAVRAVSPTIAMPARPSAATAEPALKPNQPTQSRRARHRQHQVVRRIASLRSDALS